MKKNDVVMEKDGSVYLIHEVRTLPDGKHKGEPFLLLKDRPDDIYTISLPSIVEVL